MDSPVVHSDSAWARELMAGFRPPTRVHAGVATTRTERGMTRRIAIPAIAAVVLVAGSVMLLARHLQQGGDDLYRAAEQACNRGQYADAVRLFDRMATEFPSHGKADDALYRLGYVYRNFLNEPQLALDAYGRLVKLYGKSGSPWVKHAMREIADIYKGQQEYDQALEQFASIIAQFGSDPTIHAETALQMAHTFYEQGKAEPATAACQEVLGLRGSLDAQQSEALTLMAHVALDIERDPAEAQRCLEQVIREHPESSGVKDAQKELAWIRQRYPGQGTAGVESGLPDSVPEPSLPSGEAVLVDLRRDVPGGVEDTGLFECLRVLCAAQGQVVSSNKLAGFSGQPFAFFYGDQRRLDTVRAAATDPVYAATERAGVGGARLLTCPSDDLGIRTLKSQLHRGLAALVPLVIGGKPTWRIVSGYDPARGEIYLFSATSRYEAMSGDEFRRAWSSPLRPAVSLPGHKDVGAFPMYIVEGPVAKCNAASAVECSVADGVKLLRGDVSVGDSVSGAAGFERLAADLAGLADGSLSESDQRELADWCGRPLGEFARRRGLAADHLELWRDAVYTTSADKAHITRAIELLRQSQHLLQELGGAYTRARDGTGSTEGGGSPQDLATKLANLDRQIAKELQATL